jgi:hypothetical protein
MFKNNALIKTLLTDESGFVISAELTLIVTLIFTAVAVGMAVSRDALVTEMNDVSEMIGVTSQYYHVVGIRKSKNSGKPHGECSGFGFNDQQDICDCEPVTFTSVCGKDDPSGSGRDESQS